MENCSEYGYEFDNSTKTLVFVGLPDDANYTDDKDPEWYLQAEDILDRYVTHSICLFGIIGNLINLCVLTRKSVAAHMERMEKASHIGLIALAVSDLLYCLCSSPQAWLSNDAFESPSIDFQLIYGAYGTACINCFLLSSSWLTMAMAVCHYLAICHPLRARQYLGMSTSRGIIIVVFCLSILFNLPRFWMKQITGFDCTEGGKLHFIFYGYMEIDYIAGMVYTWLYFIFGILLPLLILAYCNIYLVKALHKSSQLRRQHSSSRSSEATRVVTLTLCVIVVMYIFLVGPAELVSFWKPFVRQGDTHAYGLAVMVCNCMQMLNFAVNFILYCIINVRFRRVIRDLLLCHHIRGEMYSQTSRASTYHQRETQEEDIAML